MQGKNFVEVSSYHKVLNVFAKEILAEEEINEGIEPQEDFFDVLLTNHVCKNMADKEGREFDEDEIQTIIGHNAHNFFNLSINTKIGILSSDYKTFVVGQLVYTDMGIGFEVFTVYNNLVETYNGEMRFNNLIFGKKFRGLTTNQAIEAFRFDKISKGKVDLVLFTA